MLEVLIATATYISGHRQTDTETHKHTATYNSVELVKYCSYSA
eukprot:SAG31_NODE_15109_length_770_cov_1.956781_2_plen_42_part_01